MTITTSDMITELSNSGEDLDRLEFSIVKHWSSDNHSEKIYFQNFEQFVDYVFDLDIHGWELSGFNKSSYPRHLDTYSFYVGRVNAEFLCLEH
jgi:hypothetical protein